MPKVPLTIISSSDDRAKTLNASEYGPLEPLQSPTGFADYSPQEIPQGPGRVPSLYDPGNVSSVLEVQVLKT